MTLQVVAFGLNGVGPCRVPKIKESWVLPDYVSTNFLVSFPQEKLPNLVMEAWFIQNFEDIQMVLETTLLHVSCICMDLEASTVMACTLLVCVLMVCETETCWPKILI